MSGYYINDTDIFLTSKRRLYNLKMYYKIKNFISNIYFKFKRLLIPKRTSPFMANYFGKLIMKERTGLTRNWYNEIICHKCGHITEVTCINPDFDVEDEMKKYDDRRKDLEIYMKENKIYG